MDRAGRRDQNRDGAVTASGEQRLLSLDALRGFDMFWIMGGDALANAVLAVFPAPWAVRLRQQFEHVEWAGFRFYDLIFPLFLFLVGCVIPYSLGKYQSQPSAAALRILRRVALLVLLGLIANGLLRLQPGNLRYCGVLQRIGICYGLAAFLYLKFRVRGLMLTTLAILLGYWAVLALVPAPGGVPGDYSKAGNLAGWLDRRLLPGQIPAQWYGFGDNEGLLSTIPAVATALLGVLAGLWLKSGWSGLLKVAGLAVAGVVLVFGGYEWGRWFPIIKNIWTSSFVLVAGGFSLLLLSVFYLLIDVLGLRRPAFFWSVIGVNAITIYMVPRFVDFDRMAGFFLGGIARQAGVQWGAVVLAAGALAAQWLFLYWLYRTRTFLRL
ncbi:MAG: acyltransferase family protein [Planctomyces sp.]|jgi:predicted acyltransferase